MTGRLDRYVTKMVVGAYGACLAFMLFLSILMDMLNNMSDYLDKAEREGMGVVGLLGFLARFYLEMIPFFFVTVAPFITVIACMFAVSRLMTSNEIAPMVFSGRSMARVLRPVMSIGLLSALTMGACWEWVMPHLMESVESKQAMLGGGEAVMESIVLEPPGEPRLFVEGYRHHDLTMESVVLLVEGSVPGDTILILADRAIWHPERGDWELTGGTIARPSPTVPETIIEEPHDWLGYDAFTPESLWQAGKEDKQSAELSYSDLWELRQLRPTRKDYTLALHHHITFPLANLILLLLALPFAVHFERASKIERVIYAILICGSYLLVDLTCQSLGRQQYIHPVVAAWAPTILFGSLGFVMFGSIRS